MGIYSTVYITKTEALDYIRAGLYSASNEELAELMFDLYASKTLNNFIVVDNDIAIKEEVKFKYSIGE